jgi:hypothetical protein
LTIDDCRKAVAEIDRSLAEYLRTRPVVRFDDPHIHSLIKARKLNMRQIQSYKP